MPRSLKAQTGLVLLMGILLIPIVTSSLRGLTHVLTCTSPVTATFRASVPEEGQDPEAVVLGGPTAITRPGPGEPTTAPPSTDASTTTTTTIPPAAAPGCAGITVEMTLSTPAQGRLRVDMVVSNGDAQAWQGTISLRVGAREFPVDFGEIPGASSAERSIEVTIDSDVETVTGRLYLGP